MALDGPFEAIKAPLVAGAIATIFTAIATPIAMRLARIAGAVDDPAQDERRIHTEITPRWGGLGVYVGFLIAVLVTLPFANPVNPFPPHIVAMLVGGTVITIMGMIDDKYGLSAPQQFAYMLVVGLGIQAFSSPAGVLQIQGIQLPGVGWIHFPIAIAYALTAAYIFIVTKTMDTIDGVDGLATGIALISSVTLTLMAILGGQPITAVIAGAVGGACLGFLKWNYNPARIFLAGGAQFVGFILASISIVGAFKAAATLAIVIPLTVFGVPIIDAVIVVIRRVVAGAAITTGDRRHVHHVLLQAGLTKRQTVWILYIVAMGLSGILLILTRLKKA